MTARPRYPTRYGVGWVNNICITSAKVRHRTERAARHVLEAILTKAVNGDARRREWRDYACASCGGWHLTSME